jgi:hypothetical protein
MAKGVIASVGVPAMGLLVIAYACFHLHHWYLTGDLWVPAKYGQGWYTTYNDAPVVFVITLGLYLLFAGVGISIITRRFRT